jgi:nucleoid-associated protein YgaU
LFDRLDNRTPVRYRIERMYAAGYSIRPLRSRRQAPLRHLGRWALVTLAVASVSVGLSRVVLGDTPPVMARVVVQAGDTLWSIAAARYPEDDVRVRVDEIERLNGLHSPRIEVGETLRLPG